MGLKQSGIRCQPLSEIWKDKKIKKKSQNNPISAVMCFFAKKQKIFFFENFFLFFFRMTRIIALFFYKKGNFFFKKIKNKKTMKFNPSEVPAKESCPHDSLQIDIPWDSRSLKFDPECHPANDACSGCLKNRSTVSIFCTGDVKHPQTICPDCALAIYQNFLKTKEKTCSFCGGLMLMLSLCRK